MVKADLVAQKISESVRGKRYARYSIRNRSTIYRCSRHVYFPEQSEDSWRVVLSREDLDPDKARIIELKTQGLALMPLEDE